MIYHSQPDKDTAHELYGKSSEFTLGQMPANKYMAENLGDHPV